MTGQFNKVTFTLVKQACYEAKREARMTTQIDNKDILGEPIDEYDLVWFAAERGGLKLGCVRKALTVFSRYQSRQDERYIISYENFYSHANLEKDVQFLKGYPTHSLGCCLKVQDPVVLNSRYANSLIEKAKRLKK